MVDIPTTERKYYNTQRKVNTLSAYAGALLGSAENLQEQIQEQENIKMDSLGLEARMRMNEITKQWRLDNQSNPNNPVSLKELQNSYDSILSEYRNQIDPLYRSQWDIQGNKLKGAFDLENQNWSFAQRQENAKNDIARSINNYVNLAYSYGESGDMEKALVDFQQSYDKLLDYGAKNLGTEDAAVLLSDYQSNFYASYLDGMIYNNPNGAIELLKNKDFSSAIGTKDAIKYRKYADARIKAIKREQYNTAYSEFLENPTQEGLDRLIKLREKKMSVTELQEYLENTPNYEAISNFEGVDDAKLGIDELTTFTEAEAEDNAIFLDRVTSYIRKLQRANAEGKLSQDDVSKYSNVAYRLANDKMFAEQVNVIFGKPNSFERLVSFVGSGLDQKVKNIGLETMNGVVDRLLNNDPEGATEVYKMGQQKAIQVRYPDINFTNLKEGDIIWYEKTGQALKFVGYSLDDVLVEVDPKTGAIK